MKRVDLSLSQLSIAQKLDLMEALWADPSAMIRPFYSALSREAESGRELPPPPFLCPRLPSGAAIFLPGGLSREH
jgi:hypothetical protein